MTVYAVLGRIEHGETLDDLIADNPDIPREAFEAALVYARRTLGSDVPEDGPGSARPLEVLHRRVPLAADRHASE
jgi:hypothetical protein